jgi:hypothetical protein
MKLFHELVQELESTRSANAKKDILINNNNITLQTILKHMFEENIEFGYTLKTIPDWIPADDPAGLSISNMTLAMRKIHLFYAKNMKNQSEKQKVRIITQQLESLNANDAKILVKIICRRFKISGVTEKLVREVFPDLLEKETI